MTPEEHEDGAATHSEAAAEQRRARVLAAIDASFGIMQRDEPVEETVRRAREATEEMFRRNEHL